MVLAIAKLTHNAEYAFGILHWLGNRTYRPGGIIATGSVRKPNLPALVFDASTLGHNITLW